jgi:hypothetical protein
MSIELARKAIRKAIRYQGSRDANRMRVRALALLVVGCAALSLSSSVGFAHVSAATPLASLSFEPNDVTKWDTTGSTRHDVCCNKLTSESNKNTFVVQLEGDRRYLHNWISPSTAYQGNRSFGVELLPPSSSASGSDPFEKQRIEFELA